MKRFIDLRGQGIGRRFAWWDTHENEFDMWARDNAWDTWDEFEASVARGCGGPDHVDVDELEQFRKLCPAWAFEPTEPEAGVIPVSVVDATGRCRTGWLVDYQGGRWTPNGLDGQGADRWRWDVEWARRATRSADEKVEMQERVDQGERIGDVRRDIEGRR